MTHEGKSQLTVLYYHCIFYIPLELCDLKTHLIEEFLSK